MTTAPACRPPTLVTLSWHEVLLGCTVGVHREVQDLQREYRDRYGVTSGWQAQIEGALGEMAVAKLLGRYWSGALGRLRSADVGPYQVRATSWDGGALCLHKTDPDDSVFVLVTGKPPAFAIRGWLHGHEGKQPEWWEAKQPERFAYFVPQAYLHDIATLPYLL